MNTWKEKLFKHQKPKKYKPNDSSCVVAGSFALVLRLSRAVGMAPLSVSRAREAWRVAPSQPIATVQRLLMTAFNIMTIADLVWDFSLEPRRRVRSGESTLTAVVWFCDLLLVMLIASVAIYTGPSRMENLMQMLKQLQQINFGLKINPASSKSETLRSTVIICLVVWSTALQFADIYDLLHEATIKNKMYTGPIMAMSSAYNYANIVEIMVELQWHYSARAAHTATAAVNQQLEQLRCANLKSEPKSTQDDICVAPQLDCTVVNSFTTHMKTDIDIPMYLPQAQTTIRRLALSYDRISKVVAQLNANNGPILLVMIMSNSFRLVLSPYYLLMGLFNNDEVVMSRVMVQLNWIMFHIIKLLLIVEPCHWTQEQREQTEILLSQLTVYLAPKCERISKELDQFAKQVTLNKAKFMPLGISTLSRPLIVTILGSVTTYLIIIIQFQTISA